MSDASLPTRPSLLVRLRDLGDHAAWSDFAALYSPLIQSYLRRHGLQDADAADVAQDTLQRVMHAIGKLEYDRGKGRFRGWLLMITRQRLIDHLRRNRRQVAGSGDTAVHELLEQAPDEGDAQQWDKEYEEQLARYAMLHVEGEFEPTTWHAFCRTAIENRPAAEVAAELDITIGSVYTAKSRVTARLRRVIQEVEQED